MRLQLNKNKRAKHTQLATRVLAYHIPITVESSVDWGRLSGLTWSGSGGPEPQVSPGEGRLWLTQPDRPGYRVKSSVRIPPL